MMSLVLHILNWGDFAHLGFQETLAEAGNLALCLQPQAKSVQVWKEMDISEEVSTTGNHH